jgi:precorrin-6B methylase 2
MIRHIKFLRKPRLYIIRALQKYPSSSRLYALYRLLTDINTFLGKINWFESFRQFNAIGPNNEAYPWYTYACIDFIEKRIEKKFNIFEFGAGHSTIWWAKRVNSIISCEHEKNWIQKLSPMLPQNALLIHHNLEPGSDYENSILQYNSSFDIIIIDGRKRVECVKNSVHKLTSNGVIIWDNSDLTEYNEAYEYLKNCGFRRIDFHGMGPIQTSAWSTAIFYRQNNCFNI